LTLLEQARLSDATKTTDHPLLPKMTTFKPDEVFPIKDCVAVFDREYQEVNTSLSAFSPTDYHQYTNAFLFVMPRGRQYLLQASDEFEMNEWISLINYGSAFKTAELRMRASGMKKDQAILAGAAAAASHRRDMRSSIASSESINGRKAFGEASGDVPSSDQNQTIVLEVGPSIAPLDIDGSDGTGGNAGEQLELVFGEVKAQLAAGRGSATRSVPVVEAKDGDGDTPDNQVSPLHVARATTIQVGLDALKFIRD